MRSNVIAAAVVGLVAGIFVEILFGFAARFPPVGCIVTPIAWLFGLGLPILIGALAAMLGKSKGWLTTPTIFFDGALAAALAELVSEFARLCLGLISFNRFFPGPRFLLPSAGTAVFGLFSLVWALGWSVISLAIAGLLGAFGAFLYVVFRR